LGKMRSQIVFASQTWLHICVNHNIFDENG
jgi:hypothetical protein